MPYFDHAATSWPKHDAVALAMSEFLATGAGNAGRSSHRLGIAASDTIERCRLLLSRKLNITDRTRLALLPSCTHALNTAIEGGIRLSTDEKPHVITTVLEHNAILRPLHAAAQSQRIELTILGCDDSCVIGTDSVINAMRDDTVMLCITHASNVTGTIQPIESIARAVRGANPKTRIVVDGAQTVGVLNIDLQQIAVDAFAFGSHKGLGGPTGIGGLYLAPDFDIPPTVLGGTGSSTLALEMPNEMPTMLEAGTPNAVAAAGLIAAIEKSPNPTVLDQERVFVDRVLSWIKRREGMVAPGGDASMRTPTLSILFPDGAHDPHEIAVALDGGYDIAVRAGLHCAPLIHKHLSSGNPGGLRVSFGPTNTDEEVDLLINALDELFA